MTVDQFLDGDNVTFDNTATRKTVSVDSGGVSVGTMSVKDDYNFTGGAIASSGAVTVDAGKSLGLDIADNAPALTAATIDFNGTGILKITGYTPAADVDLFTAPLNVATVISTTGGVSNFSDMVTVAGQTGANAFLTAYASVDGNDVKVETGLYWYSSDPTREAHGAFTIAGDDTFTLGAALADNSASTNKAPGWDGNSLTKTGTGTLVLTAANTYTGTTAIGEGILRLANPNAVASSAVSVASGATLAVDQSSNVASLSLADGSTLAIALGDAVTATGTVILSGVTTIDLSVSALVAGSYDILIGSGVTGFAPANFTTLFNGGGPPNRANVAYSLTGSGTTVTLDLSIKNLAIAWMGGSGGWSDVNWTNSSDNHFYAGDSVTFDSGTGTVTVDSSGVEVADMAVSGGDYAFSGGSISSTTATTLPGTKQKLTISGGGSATFANDVDFTGGIAVGSGGALYGSASMAGGVSVASGGTFGATAGGVLRVDNLTMDSGSTLAVADSASLVSVAGAADISSDVGFTFGSGFTAGNTYTILTAGSGITSWSGPLEAMTSALLRYIVKANGSTELVVVVEEYRQLIDLGLTPNQAAALSGLEGWNDGSNEILDAIKALGTDAGALAALDALTGQLHRNLPAAMIGLNRGFWRLLDGPVFSLREDAETAASGDGRALASLNPRARFGPEPLLWFSGGGLYSRSRSEADTARNRLNGTEFMVGGETPVAGWNLGLVFRYADTSVKVDERASRAALDNYQLGLYAMRAVPLGSGQLRLTLGAVGGYHDIESRRNVVYGATAQSLSSGYDAWSFSGLAEAGYRFDASPRLAVEPYVSLGWDGVWSESFRESGGSAALRGDSAHQGNLSTILGNRLAYRLTERVSVDVNAGWRHTYGSVRPRSGMAFAASPTRDSFTIVGTKLARDEFTGGIGARVDLTNRVFLRADYRLEAGGGGHSHRGTLSVGVGF